METMKEFLKKYGWLKITIQHLDLHGGGWQIEVHNTTYDLFEPIFKHYVTDMEMDNLNVAFETVVMTPIISWWDSLRKGANRVTKKE